MLLNINGFNNYGKKETQTLSLSLDEVYIFHQNDAVEFNPNKP